MSAAPAIPQGRKEYKDEQLLARLIGAAVLLAIAVIVLPFVLDGAGSQREYEYADTLPVEPARPVLEKSFSSRQPLPETPSASDVPTVVTQAPPVFESTAVQQPAAPPTEPAVSSPVVQNPVVQNPAPAVLLPQQIPSGYNVQVASFVKEANAQKLVGRLLSENLPAYVNQVQGKNRPILRVFVGPLASQIDALALKNQIDRTYQVESILVTRN